MEGVVDSSLRRITKGAIVFFVGSIVGLIAGFFVKVIVARYLNPSEFGVLSLSFVVFVVFNTFFTLGIPVAMTRQASYYLGKREIEKAKAIMKISGNLVLLLGLTSAVILFFISDSLAKFFKIPALSWTLKVFSLAIPFTIVRNYLIEVFRIRERADVKVVFGDIIPNVSKLSFIAVVVFLGLSFFYVVWAYSLAIILSGIAILLYSFKKIDFRTTEKSVKYLGVLIIFAIPLLLQSVLGLVITWTDTIMIGYFMKASDVGLYSSAQPVASLMCTVLASVGFLYFPIVSKLYAENHLKEAGRTYAVITKWLTSAVMPAFLVMVLFPKAVLWVLYGGKYIGAYEVLRILAVGFFFHVMLGPNGATLLCFGKAKEVTFASLVAAVSNVVLNFLLIPKMGINGAAIASAVAYISSNVIVSMLLYVYYGIHPFTKNYIKPALTSSFLAFAIYSLAKGIAMKWWMLISIFVLFVFVYFVSLLVTRSFDREDISLMLAMEQRLGLNLGWVKRVLRRFI